MTDLGMGEEGRALLELARDAHDPTDEDRARVRSALASRLGAAAGLGLAGSLAASPKTTTAAGAATASLGATAGVGTMKGLLAAKLIGAAVVATSAVWGGAAVVHRAQHIPTVALTAPAPASAACPQPRVMLPPPLHASLPDREVTAPPALVTRPLGASVRKPSTLDVAPTVLPPPMAPPAEAAPAEARDGHVVAETPPSLVGDRAAKVDAQSFTPALADEARLMHDGMVALRTGRPARALALFDAHAIFYPHGALAMEREAERALALADLGRAAEARAAAQAFLRVQPASPLAAHLRKRLRDLDGK